MVNECNILNPIVPILLQKTKTKWKIKYHFSLSLTTIIKPDYTTQLSTIKNPAPNFNKTFLNQ